MKIIFTLILSCIVVIIYGQNTDKNRTNHWYFGQNAGLDFSSGTAVADTNGKMTFLNRTSTISDTAGNLLFYTNGATVWNSQHDTMLNGFGLGVPPNTTPFDAVVIVPKPGNPNVYYVFTVDGYEHQYLNGLSWHEVDMTLDGGKGAVTSKNNILFTPSTEQIAATKHANGCDYWVTSHELNSANFRSYLVTASGIDTVPVISTIGEVYNPIPLQYSMGQNLVFSHNGSKANVSVSHFFPNTNIRDSIELYDFNNATGTLSNLIHITIDSTCLAGEFSPNNQLLYLEMGYWHRDLWQYDISTGVGTIINNSKILLHTSQKGIAHDFLNGRDGKIYMCNITFALITMDSLSIINNPNIVGTGCNVQARVLPLFRKTTEGLNNFVSNFVIADSSSLCATSINESTFEKFKLFPNPADKFVTVRDNMNIKLRSFEIRIYDYTGKIALTQKGNYAEAIISLDHLSNGIYLVKVLSSYKDILSQIVIVQH